MNKVFVCLIFVSSFYLSAADKGRRTVPKSAGVILGQFIKDVRTLSERVEKLEQRDPLRHSIEIVVPPSKESERFELRELLRWVPILKQKVLAQEKQIKELSEQIALSKQKQ